MSQKRYAYLIGANGPENIRLQYAETDVTRLAEILQGPVCQFTEVKTVIAHSSGEGLTTFQPFVEKCDASDTLLVHFSGHAFFDTIDQQLYLLCNNTDSNNLITAIDISVIKRILRRSRAQSKLLILDCCHAKAAYDVKSEESEEEIHDLVKKAAQGSMSAILSACARKDKTREFRDLDGGSGFLSWAVRAACSTRLEDASSDPEKKALSLSDLDRWVKRALEEINTDLNLHPPLPPPYLLRDQAVGNEIWLTPPPSLNRNASMTGNEKSRRRYLNEVSKRYSSVTLPIGSSEGLSLHAIFQPLVLRSDPLAAEDLVERKQRRKFLGELPDNVLDDPIELPHGAERSRETNVPAQPKIVQNGEEALNESPKGRIVILGGPGTGKTTTLRYLVSRRAQEAIEKATSTTHTLLPIFLSLADLARSSQTFQAYLQTIVEDLLIDRSYAEELWKTIESGHAFVALDSLDEVPPALRQKMIELINSLAAKHGNVWIVGSRFMDYKGGQLKHGQFDEWELLSMTPQLRRELATKLLPELLQLPLVKTTASPSPLTFVTLLEKHPQAAAWGENPLLFSLAAVVYVKTGGLPSSRSALYNEVVEAILTLKEPDHSKRHNLSRALTGLALWLYQEKKGRTFSMTELFTFLKDTQGRTWHETEEMSRQIKTSSIMDVVARDTYGFRHQTFQEYLAAVELAQQLTSTEEKRAKAYELAWSKRRYSRWTEVLCLMVGTLVQLPGRQGGAEAQHWLKALIAQRINVNDDPGDLGLALAFKSLNEVTNTKTWKTVDALQLEQQITNLWLETLFMAVRTGRRVRRDRLMALAQNNISLTDYSFVLPQLLENLRDDALVRGEANSVFQKMGKNLTPVLLLPLLQDDATAVRSAAVLALGNQGENSPIEVLVNMLVDPEAAVRSAAVLALGNQGENSPIEVLVNMLVDPEAAVRSAAVKALGNQGENSPIEVLVNMLVDPEAAVRSAAEEVVLKQESRLSIETLMDMLTSDSYHKREIAVKLLKKQGKQVPVDTLLEMVTQHDIHMQESVAALMEDQWEEVLDVLQGMLTDSNAFVRAGVVKILSKQREHVSIDILLGMLTDSNAFVRATVKEAVRERGEGIPIDILQGMLTDSNAFVRATVKKALGEPEKDIPIDILLGMLTDSNAFVRAVAVKALSKQREHVPIDVLLGMLTDHDENIRVIAVNVLKSQGEYVPIETLIEALSNQDGWVKATVVELLEKTRKEQIPLEIFVEMLADRSEKVRIAAVNILKSQEKYREAEIVSKIVARNTGQELLAALDSLIGAEERISAEILLKLLKDNNAYIRLKSLKYFKLQEGIFPIKILLDSLRDPYSNIRSYALEELLNQKEQIPVEVLVGMLNDDDVFVRSIVVYALGDQGERVPVDVLLRAFNDETGNVIASALDSLRRQKDRVPLNILLRALVDALGGEEMMEIYGEGERELSEMSLILTSNQPLFGTVLETLKEYPGSLSVEALKDTHWSVRVAALIILSEQKKFIPMEMLIEALDDPVEQVKLAALNALSNQDIAVPLSVLNGLLKDNDASVRSAAVNILGKQGEPVPIKVLLEMLADRDESVQAIAVNILNKQEEQVPVDVLARLLADRDASVREVAIQVSTTQRELIPVDVLLRTLDNHFGELEEQIEAIWKVLEKQEEQIPVNTLLNVLINAHGGARVLAMKALGAQRDQIPVDIVLGALADSDADVRTAAAKVLSQKEPTAFEPVIAEAIAILQKQPVGPVFSSLRQGAFLDIIKNTEYSTPQIFTKVTELLDWPYWQIRVKAIEILGKLRRNVPDIAIQRLLELRHDPNPLMECVRIAADDALAEILSLENGIEDD